MFIRITLTHLCSKSGTFAHAQLVITLLHILLANILTWHQLETYIKYVLLDEWGNTLTS